MGNEILQGTTPTLRINIDPNLLSLSSINKLELSLWQKYGISTKKNLSDVTIDYENNTVSYHFSESETLNFISDYPLCWQMRLLMPDGNIFGTIEQQIDVKDLHSKEEMAE